MKHNTVPVIAADLYGLIRLILTAYEDKSNTPSANRQLESIILELALLLEYQTDAADRMDVNDARKALLLGMIQHNKDRTLEVQAALKQIDSAKNQVVLEMCPKEKNKTTKETGEQKAYLVTISACTRVTSNTGEKAVQKAINKIKTDPASYIIQDNLEEVREDEECPYGTFEEDKEETDG